MGRPCHYCQAGPDEPCRPGCAYAYREDPPGADRAEREGPVRYIVRQRQVTVYEWTVECETELQAEETAHEGVPDAARTVSFTSSVEVEVDTEPTDEPADVEAG